MSVKLVELNCDKCGKKIYTNLSIKTCPACLLGKKPAHAPTRKTNSPSWVGIVSYFRTSEDTGVGDTVQRYAAMLGGEQFKAWAKKLGMPCGCTTRQAEWNARYPYTAPHDQQQSSSH